MTAHRKLLASVRVSSALVVLAAIGAWSTTVPPVPRQVRRPDASPRSPAPIDTGRLRASAAMIRHRDAFRLERRPTSVRYNPWEPVDPAAATSHPRPGRPTLTLAGLLGGPPWHAVVEGIPGREGGVLLRLGEEVLGVRLREIRGDTAVLSGFDTTWTLTTRRAWR